MQGRKRQKLMGRIDSQTSAPSKSPLAFGIPHHEHARYHMLRPSPPSHFAPFTNDMHRRFSLDEMEEIPEPDRELRREFLEIDEEHFYDDEQAPLETPTSYLEESANPFSSDQPRKQCPPTPTKTPPSRRKRAISQSMESQSPEISQNCSFESSDDELQGLSSRLQIGSPISDKKSAHSKLLMEHKEDPSEYGEPLRMEDLADPGSPDAFGVRSSGKSRSPISHRHSRHRDSFSAQKIANSQNRIPHSVYTPTPFTSLHGTKNLVLPSPSNNSFLDSSSRSLGTSQMIVSAQEAAPQLRSHQSKRSLSPIPVKSSTRSDFSSSSSNLFLQTSADKNNSAMKIPFSNRLQDVESFSESSGDYENLSSIPTSIDFERKSDRPSSPISSRPVARSLFAMGDNSEVLNETSDTPYTEDQEQPSLSRSTAHRHSSSPWDPDVSESDLSFSQHDYINQNGNDQSKFESHSSEWNRNSFFVGAPRPTDFENTDFHDNLDMLGSEPDSSTHTSRSQLPSQSPPARKNHRHGQSLSGENVSALELTSISHLSRKHLEGNLNGSFRSSHLRNSPQFPTSSTSWGSASHSSSSMLDSSSRRVDTTPNISSHSSISPLNTRLCASEGRLNPRIGNYFETAQLNPFSPRSRAFQRSEECSMTGNASFEEYADEEFLDRNRLCEEFVGLGSLGHGSFGDVYRVRHVLDGCEYAVKVIKTRFSGQRKRAEILRECLALASIDDPNVLRYYSAWVENNKLHIQTELCENTLADVMKARLFSGEKFAEDELREILRDLASGLRTVHNFNMVHLDLKPENFYVTRSGRYKLGDFGQVMFYLENDHNSSDIRDGDARYLCPEVLDDKREFLRQADIFALGASMYELARGSPLPSGGEEYHRIRAGQLDELPHLSHDFINLLLLMMHPDPTMRPLADSVLDHPGCCGNAFVTIDIQRRHLASLTEQLKSQCEVEDLLRSKIASLEHKLQLFLNPDPRSLQEYERNDQQIQEPLSSPTYANPFTPSVCDSDSLFS